MSIRVQTEEDCSALLTALVVLKQIGLRSTDASSRAMATEAASGLEACGVTDGSDTRAPRLRLVKGDG